MKQLKQLITQSIKTKLNTIYTNKVLKFQLYHQEMFVSMDFLLVKRFYQKKNC